MSTLSSRCSSLLLSRGSADTRSSGDVIASKGHVNHPDHPLNDPCTGGDEDIVDLVLTFPTPEQSPVRLTLEGGNQPIDFESQAAVAEFLDKPELYVRRAIDPAPPSADSDSESDAEDDEQVRRIRTQITTSLAAQRSCVESKDGTRYEVRCMTDELAAEAAESSNLRTATPKEVRTFVREEDEDTEDEVKPRVRGRASMTEFLADEPRTEADASNKTGGQLTRHQPVLNSLGQFSISKMMFKLETFQLANMHRFRPVETPSLTTENLLENTDGVL